MGRLRGRRIALIGGAGFIGHNAALMLKAEGASVTVLDSLAVNNHQDFRTREAQIPNNDLYLRMLDERQTLLREAGIPIMLEDARDPRALLAALREVMPDSIVHLAAVAHANRSNKDPHFAFDHSLRTLENALEAARSPELAIKHFVYFSSSMVYGHFLEGFVTEESRCEPIGIYGALKFAGEKLVIAYNQVFDLPYTIVRPSALYGPRCVSRRVGQVFIENAMQGLDISISGDGSFALDFTHVNDVSAGVVAILANEASKNELFNITYGEARSVAQMADIVRAHFPSVNVKYLPKDALTPDRGTLSIEKARRLLGYRPEHPLESGFVEYIEWYKSLWATAAGMGDRTPASFNVI